VRGQEDGREERKQDLKHWRYTHDKQRPNVTPIHSHETDDALIRNAYTNLHLAQAASSQAGQAPQGKSTAPPATGNHHSNLPSPPSHHKTGTEISVHLGHKKRLARKVREGGTGRLQGEVMHRQENR